MSYFKQVETAAKVVSKEKYQKQPFPDLVLYNEIQEYTSKKSGQLVQHQYVAAYKGKKLIDQDENASILITRLSPKYGTNARKTKVKK